MAPSLIVGYYKDLHQFPECDSRHKNRIGYFITPDFSLVRVTEWMLVNSPEKFQYCLTVTSIGGIDNEWFQEIALDELLAGQPEADIIEYIRNLGVEDVNDDDPIARFVYKDFIFRSQTGHDSGIQIKGAFVDRSKEQRALARTVYGFLLNWHNHVFSDNHQTVYGAKIWAKGMLLLGRVQVYDDIQKRFIDVLAQGAVGYGNVKPWDAMQLNEQQRSQWNPNAISIDPADKILAVISAVDRLRPIGITTFDSTKPILKVVNFVQ